ncbi:MAG: SRPBCC family protein [Halorhabdus sp.]
MAVYERSVTVRAPFEIVWDFHSTVDGLEALTPDWLNLALEDVRGPDDTPDPPEMVPGSTAVVSLRPFGIGPRQMTTTRIVERDRSEDEGYFVDVMTGGPFSRFEHTHRFEAVAGGTRVTDRVEYDLVGGPCGRIVSPLAVVGIAPLFRYRHRRTKSLLE